MQPVTVTIQTIPHGPNEFSALAREWSSLLLGVRDPL